MFDVRDPKYFYKWNPAKSQTTKTSLINDSPEKHRALKIRWNQQKALRNNRNLGMYVDSNDDCYNCTKYEGSSLINGLRNAQNAQISNRSVCTCLMICDAGFQYQGFGLINACPQNKKSITNSLIYQLNDNFSINIERKLIITSSKPECCHYRNTRNLRL